MPGIETNSYPGGGTAQWDHPRPSATHANNPGPDLPPRHRRPTSSVSHTFLPLARGPSTGVQSCGHHRNPPGSVPDLLARSAGRSCMAVVLFIYGTSRPNAQVIAGRIGQILAHAKVPFGGGDGGVAQGELDLLKGRVPLVCQSCE